MFFLFIVSTLLQLRNAFLIILQIICTYIKSIQDIGTLLIIND